MSYVTKNTISVSGNSVNVNNLFWFGKDGLKVGSTADGGFASGLVVDSSGVGVIMPKESNSPDLFSLADRLSAINTINDYNRVDLFSGLDQTLGVLYLSARKYYGNTSSG